MRKVIFLTADLCKENGLTDWRQYHYNFRVLKRLMRTAQNKKRGNPKLEDKKKRKEKAIQEAHRSYIKASAFLLERAKATLLTIKSKSNSLMTEIKKNRD